MDGPNCLLEEEHYQNNDNHDYKETSDLTSKILEMQYGKLTLEKFGIYPIFL